MDPRIVSTLGYLGTVAAAVLAAVVMSGQAWAEGPIDVLPPFVGGVVRAQVQAEVLQDPSTGIAGGIRR